MPKDIAFDAEARKALAAGVHTLAQAVKVTLGPKGRYVAIAEGSRKPGITNDGVTVARDIDFEDPVMQMGAKIVREAAGKTDRNVGDGTTTATLLTDEIVTEGMRNITAGADPIGIRRGIQKATDVLVASLKEEAVAVDSPEQIANVGAISSGNAEIGEKIAEAMAEVGKDGVIICEKSNTFGIQVDAAKGMLFERGFLSPYMADDMGNMKGELDDPFIFITDQEIKNIQDIVPVLEGVIQAKRPLLIVTEYLSPEVLETLLLNQQRGTLKVAAVKPPDAGDKRKKQLEDMAVLTGGTYISPEFGIELSDANVSMLGRAKNVRITKDTTLISSGLGDPEAIAARVAQIKAQIEECNDSRDKALDRERVAKLSGGIGILRIGAATEAELLSVRRRVEDALRATQSAVREGIVAGGGTALLRAAARLDEIECANNDELVGVDIMRRAAEAPLRTIAENAGLNGSNVVDEVKKLDGSWGFNAATGEYADMVATGVTDPTEVVRISLQTAASLACLLLITEVTVNETPKEPITIDDLMGTKK